MTVWCKDKTPVLYVAYILIVRPHARLLTELPYAYSYGNFALQKTLRCCGETAKLISNILIPFGSLVSLI